MLQLILYLHKSPVSLITKFVRQRYQSMASKIHPSIRAFFSQVVPVVPIIYMIHDTTVSASRVEGESMQPTLNPRGIKSNDFVLLNRLRNDYERGDVVVFKSPRDPSSLMIKRIIGVEGDRVRTLPRCRNDDDIRVPKGHVWVEGDCDRSFDSSHFGPIPKALIRAHASHIIWPPSRWSKIESKYPADRVYKNSIKINK